MRVAAKSYQFTAFKKPPFRIDEKGWGEFDMSLVLTGAHKGGEHTLPHDLNFQNERYEATHVVVCHRVLCSYRFYIPALDLAHSD